MKMNVDLSTTTPIEGPNGEKIFQDGYVLRKVSKFLTGGQEDGIIPIPCFYEPTTGKIVLETLPPQLRGEYKEYSINAEK